MGAGHPCRRHPHRSTVKATGASRAASPSEVPVTLSDLGFSDVQELTYRALLARPDLDAAALGSMSGASEQAVSAALDDLAAREVIRHDHVAPSGYAPRDPAVAVGGLIDDLEEA